jgi:hypothetical protein
MKLNVSTLPQPRQHLSADGLFATLRARFGKFTDARTDPAIPLEDALLSGLAVFALKDPSLLAFEERRSQRNLRALFGIERAPSDTQMREILDPLDPEQLREAFQDVFRALQRGKALEPLVFHDGAYLLALDGTGYFSSTKVHCPSCLEKVNSKTGVTTYHHQMLGAALVHPDSRAVIPLAPEPIIKQDGTTKNDCERNACKRLLEKIRREHPHLKLIVIEDALASNAPHIEELMRHQMHYILGVKPGDHKFLFDRWVEAHDGGTATTVTWELPKGGTGEASFAHGLPLNGSHQDLRINFLQYVETDHTGKTVKQFTWVTDLDITQDNARHLVAGARARWKIENETFNTLKNQGYHCEHNFGHGQRNLSVVFAMLMMLAFLVDQTQQLCCPLFQAVVAQYRTRRSLWEKLRSYFYHFEFTSMRHMYEVILLGLGKNVPAPQADTG